MRLPEQGLSPFAIVNSIRRPAFIARDLIFRFRNGRLIKRLANLSAAPLLRLLAIARIGYEMLQSGEEEGPEMSLLAIGTEVGAIADEFGEKSLRQILRILGSDSFASQEKIKRTPINAAKLGERFESARRRNCRSSGVEHHCPSRGSKLSVLRGFGGGRRGHVTFLFEWRKISNSIREGCASSTSADATG